MEILRNENHQEVEVIAFHLYPDILRKIYENEIPTTIIKNTTNIKSKKVVDFKIISKFVESLDFYFQNPTLVNEDLLELKIKELVLLLIQSKNVQSILELIRNLYSSRSTKFKDIISLHKYSNLTIEELAKLSQMSLSTFKREFKKEFNETPLNYLTKKRMEHALYLLSVSEKSISEIAFEIGYKDPQYFARIFKNKVGFTPSSFRVQFMK